MITAVKRERGFGAVARPRLPAQRQPVTHRRGHGRWLCVDVAVIDDLTWSVGRHGGPHTTELFATPLVAVFATSHRLARRDAIM